MGLDLPKDRSYMVVVYDERAPAIGLVGYLNLPFLAVSPFIEISIDEYLAQVTLTGYPKFEDDMADDDKHILFTLNEETLLLEPADFQNKDDAQHLISNIAASLAVRGGADDTPLRQHAFSPYYNNHILVGETRIRTLPDWREEVMSIVFDFSRGRRNFHHANLEELFQDAKRNYRQVIKPLSNNPITCSLLEQVKKKRQNLANTD